VRRIRHIFGQIQYSLFFIIKRRFDDTFIGLIDAKPFFCKTEISETDKVADVKIKESELWYRFFLSGSAAEIGVEETKIDLPRFSIQ
jgi:hypothetical protein